MAPRTAASVCWCALFCFVLCVNSVFCDDTRSSLTREELMNNSRGSFSQFSPPNFGNFGHSGQRCAHLCSRSETPEERETGRCTRASSPARTTHSVTGNISL